MGIADGRSGRVPKDLAKRLGIQGIRKLLTILTDAYRDLYGRRWVRRDSPEDSITEEWYVHILKRWSPENAFGLAPLQQKQDTHRAKRRGRPPAIDFCFRDEFFQQSYFGTECKLLDQGNRRYLRAYLDDEKGIGRFLSGKYASPTSAGGMVGHVRTGDCKDVAQDLARGVRGLAGAPQLKKSTPLPRFEQLYESTHDRQDGVSPFRCFHLLFAFDCSAA